MPKARFSGGLCREHDDLYKKGKGRYMGGGGVPYIYIYIYIYIHVYTRIAWVGIGLEGLVSRFGVLCFGL